MGDLELILASGLSLALSLIAWMVLWVHDKSEQSAAALRAVPRRSPAKRGHEAPRGLPGPRARDKASGAATDWPRQISKWVTSGLLTFLFVGLFLMLLATSARAVGALRPDAVTAFLSATSSAQDPMVGAALMLLALAVVAVVIAVPVGYVQYQLYYWLYWGGVGLVGRNGDIGYEMLKDTDPAMISRFGGSLERAPGLRAAPSLPGLRLWRFPGTGTASEPGMRVHRRNMSMADSVWAAALDARHALDLDKHAASLGDIYHSLGAVRVSIAVAYASFLLLTCLIAASARRSDLSVAGAVAVVLDAIVAYLLMVMITRTREDVLSQLIRYKHDILTFFCGVPQPPAAERAAGTCVDLLAHR
jgi:hypothetical protein